MSIVLNTHRNHLLSDPKVLSGNEGNNGISFPFNTRTAKRSFFAYVFISNTGCSELIGKIFGFWSIHSWTYSAKKRQSGKKVYISIWVECSNFSVIFLSNTVLLFCLLMMHGHMSLCRSRSLLSSHTWLFFSFSCQQKKVEEIVSPFISVLWSHDLLFRSRCIGLY